MQALPGMRGDAALQTVEHWASGRRWPKQPERLDELALGLGVTVAQLFEAEE